MTLTINPHEDLGLQIAQALHPVLTAAEEEENKQPRRPDLPNLKWSTAIKVVLKAHDVAWGEWAEANTTLAGAIGDYREAVQHDQSALLKAAASGADKHPGKKATEKAAEALEWALEKCRAHRRKCDATLDGTIEQQIQLEIDSYIDQVKGRVENAELMLEAAVSNARDTYEQARRESIVATQQIVWLKPYIRDLYGINYDSSPHDFAPSINWPKGYVLKLTWAHDILSHIERSRAVRRPQG
jgi:hypothetical protein